MSAIQLDVVTARRRVGCKGPTADSWLATHGIKVPRDANSYEVDANGVLAARLATSEFLLESTSTASDEIVGSVRNALHGGDYPKGVYPVLRADFVLDISGEQTDELFLQICAVDLAPVARASSSSAGPVVMTSMIGVSVVLACRRAETEPHFTVWSDPSYSTYFHSQLQAIAADVSGRY